MGQERFDIIASQSKNIGKNTNYVLNTKARTHLSTSTSKIRVILILQLNSTKAIILLYCNTRRCCSVQLSMMTYDDGLIIIYSQKQRINDIICKYSISFIGFTIVKFDFSIHFSVV